MDKELAEGQNTKSLSRLVWTLVSPKVQSLARGCSCTISMTFLRGSGQEYAYSLTTLSHTLSLSYQRTQRHYRKTLKIWLHGRTSGIYGVPRQQVCGANCLREESSCPCWLQATRPNTDQSPVSQIPRSDPN